MIYCTACGKQYSPNATYCIHCGEPNSMLKNKQKSMIVALILALLAGSMGIHRFYLGKIGTGIIMIVLLLLYLFIINPIVTSQLLYARSFSPTILLSILPYIWPVIDAFRIGTRNMKDAKGNDLK